jgi:rhodanese-related sulfurtransferase
LWNSVKKMFAQPASQPAPPAFDEPAFEEPADDAPPQEVTPAQVQSALAEAEPPLLLDVREQYEWEQVRIPASLHIPMNSVPDRLGELPRGRAIVVLCAHGSRSYGVAHFLGQQGFNSASLSGGITQWRIQGGAVEVGRPPA